MYKNGRYVILDKLSGETLGKLNRSWRKPQRKTARSPSWDKKLKLSIFIPRAILPHRIKSNIFANPLKHCLFIKLNINAFFALYCFLCYITFLYFLPSWFSAFIIAIYNGQLELFVHDRQAHNNLTSRHSSWLMWCLKSYFETEPLNAVAHISTFTMPICTYRYIYVPKQCCVPSHLSFFNFRLPKGEKTLLRFN